jgi:hypothetical protein
LKVGVREDVFVTTHCPLPQIPGNVQAADKKKNTLSHKIVKPHLQLTTKEEGRKIQIKLSFSTIQHPSNIHEE